MEENILRKPQLRLMVFQSRFEPWTFAFLAFFLLYHDQRTPYGHIYRCMSICVCMSHSSYELGNLHVPRLLPEHNVITMGTKAITEILRQQCELMLLVENTDAKIRTQIIDEAHCCNI
jgi:hypothetical protein